MVNYDLLVLSPFEFENLSRDLVQKKLGLVFESFTTGPDDGIDFRYAPSGTGNIIIQVKRYQDFTSLRGSLKKEVAKVHRLSPARYILTTSVGLSPKHKEEILALFHPFIQSKADILGREDLNNLLGLYPEVENAYYKLWIAGTHVLQQVLNNGIFHQSAFELNEIRKQVQLYVPNASLPQAIEILKAYNYLIISGIPGIGKTTLARMVVLHLLSNGYEELVYLQDSIEEGYRYFNPARKQVFLFDDFLGSNVFEKGKLINQDNKIIRFIKMIQATAGKAFILTTREYILSQAMDTMTRFRESNIGIAQCLLDVSCYTGNIKAQILYNHLYFSNIPKEYLADLLFNDRYLSLVLHKNFSPRIIEAALNSKFWNAIDTKDFSTVLTSYFDKPDSVWRMLFEDLSDDLPRQILLVLASIDTMVFLEDLLLAVTAFRQVAVPGNSPAVDAFHFKRSIRELELIFLKTSMDANHAIVVSFQHASIADFLFRYLDENPSFVSLLLQGALFEEQFYSFPYLLKSLASNEPCYNPALLKEFVNQLDIKYAHLASCWLESAEKKDRDLAPGENPLFYYYKTRRNKPAPLQNIPPRYNLLHYLMYCPIYDEYLYQVLHQKFQASIYIRDYEEAWAYIELFGILDHNKLSFDGEAVIRYYINHLNTFTGIGEFMEFRSKLPSAYKALQEDKDWQATVKSRITALIQEYRQFMAAYELLSIVNDIEECLELSLDDLITELDEAAFYELYDLNNWRPKRNAPKEEAVNIPGTKVTIDVKAIGSLFRQLAERETGPTDQ
jgi:hypothetical protein